MSTKDIRQLVTTPTHAIVSDGTAEASNVGYRPLGDFKANLGLGTSLTQTANNGNGTAGTPAFAFVGDENTGIYRPGADALGFVTNGSEKVRIDDTGNVLVGTTTTGGPNPLLNDKVHVFNVQNTALGTPQAVLKGGLSAPSGTTASSRGNAQVTHWVKAVPAAGNRDKFIIPFISQGSLNQNTLVRVLARVDRFNTNDTPPLAFEATFAVGHLTTLASLTTLSSGGNVSSLTTNGMNVEINLTSALTAGDVVVAYLEVMSYQNDRSVDYDNIAVA
jgi:hypothetical protein